MPFHLSVCAHDREHAHYNLQIPEGSRVEACTAKANDFAKPILQKIRTAVHKEPGKSRNWKYE